ncbi:AfsR/SARP family transcriptional regulator [Nocardioides aequoreus]|uniref:AfsR/SARP family transcriptional regulator n=1 Tax=Nocardioides aequoreus TaxID=397278 RepID=UPI0012F6A794|nr:hypothetical protein [Nocardioides aequoreus]
MSAALTLLGALTYRHADEAVAAAVVVPTTKALDLLRLLVGAGHVALGAGHYIALLWPEADADRGRMSLRTALAQLRRALGPEVVQRDGDLLRLGDVETDVARLRRAGKQVERLRRAGDDAGVVAAALALERECGADLVVSPGSCEAVFALRDELRAVRGDALLDAATSAHRLGWDRECLGLAQRADSLLGSETSARALMVAWAALGETRRSIEVFEQLQATLLAAYGVQPSAATRATYLQVVTSGIDVTLRSAEHHRDVVVSLAGDLAELTRERGGVVWLLGEPGSGRGVVAREAVRLLGRTAPERAARVLILPEVVALDEAERARLHAEAEEHHSVLVVPLRQPAPPPAEQGEIAVRVEPLTRQEFHDLLAHLLQEQPSEQLEQRLWSTTGGLAGLTTRAVGTLIEGGRVRWGPGTVGIA